jgi:hypothetical protein
MVGSMVLTKDISEISSHFCENTDLALFESLLDVIRNDNCCVFVGAGISVNSGYPLTTDLLEHIRTQSDVSIEELEEKADFREKASFLHERMGDEFFEALSLRFDSDHFNINSSVAIQEHLVHLPFKSYVTTNYDSCIADAAALQDIKFEDSQSYPVLSIKNLEQFGLYQIHGRIYPNDVQRSSDIVFTSESYDEAYAATSRLPLLLNGIFDTYDFLFLGFGLEEPMLEAILALCKRREEVPTYWGNNASQRRRRFALLPIMEEHMDPSVYSKEQLQAHIDKMRQKDDLMNRDYGIMVIRYYANKYHSQLKKIVEYMYRIFGKRPKEKTSLSRQEVEI